MTRRKKILAWLLLLSLTVAVTAWAVSAEALLLIDDADLLSYGEEAAVLQQLQAVSGQYGAQIAVVTTDSLGGVPIDTYVDMLYDRSGYGYGDDRSGVLLLIAMDTREYRILTNGFADAAVDGESVGDGIVSYLSDGAYAAAMEAYAEECAYYLDGHMNGFPFEFGTNLLIAIAVGLLIGLVVALILKGQLKSVHRQDRANIYVKPGSMHLTQSGEYFMYRTVSKTEKPQNNSSSGGARSSRSISGGKF